MRLDSAISDTMTTATKIATKKVTIKFSSVSNIHLFLGQLKTRNYDISFTTNELIGFFSSGELEYAIGQLNEEVILEENNSSIGLHIVSAI